MKRGFSTIELLIAFAIAIMTMSAVLMVIGVDQSAVTDSEINNEALHKAQDMVETAVANARTNYSAIVPIPPTTVTSGGLSYTKKLEIPVQYQTQCSESVIGTVSWTGSYGRNLSVSSMTQVVDIPELFRLGGCSTTLPIDWDNPDTYAQVDITPSGNKGTSVDVVSMPGLGKYAVVGSKHSSVGSSDISIINVTDPLSIPTPTSINTGKGTNDLEVATAPNGHTYIYALQDSATNQLQTIDMTNPSMPVTGATVSFDTLPPPYTVGGTDPEGHTITYYNGRLYIGLYSTVGSEFLVFDVAADPASPAFIGAISPSFNHNIYDIVVKGNFAYLATSYDSRELMVINISAANPVDTGQGLNVNGSAPGSPDATALALVGSRLYMGMERVTAANKNFYIVDVSVALSPALLGPGKYISLNPSTARISGLAVAGPYAFLGTTDSNGGFQVWRIDDPSNINQPFPSCQTYNYSEKSTDLTYFDNYVYISNESNRALRIIYDQPSAC